MRNTIYKLICILCLTGLVIEAPAQEPPVEKDLGSWIGATLKLDLTKKWRFEIEQQLRFENYLASFDETFTEVGVRYKFNKMFNIKGQYRYSFTSDDHNESRISLDLNFKYDIKGIPIDIKYRLRLQDEKVAWTGQKKTYMRHRIGLDYNMSKLVDPYIDYESFYKFNDDFEFRANRYTFGLQWKLNKRSELDTFFQFENEFNKRIREHEFVVGLAYTYELNLYKKKGK